MKEIKEALINKNTIKKITAKYIKDYNRKNLFNGDLVERGDSVVGVFLDNVFCKKNKDVIENWFVMLTPLEGLGMIVFGKIDPFGEYTLTYLREYSLKHKTTLDKDLIPVRVCTNCVDLDKLIKMTKEEAGEYIYNLGEEHFK